MTGWATVTLGGSGCGRGAAFEHPIARRQQATTQRLRGIDVQVMCSPTFKSAPVLLTGPKLSKPAGVWKHKFEPPLSHSMCARYESGCPRLSNQRGFMEPLPGFQRVKRRTIYRPTGETLPGELADLTTEALALTIEHYATESLINSLECTASPRPDRRITAGWFAAGRDWSVASYVWRYAGLTSL